ALAPGRRLGPVEIGLAASLGVTALRVRRRPCVAVLSTGDELGAPTEVGGIQDSNRPALILAITHMGGEVIDLGVIPDRRDRLEQALYTVAGQVDAIVSSGGASVGEADHVRAVLDRLGRVRFWQVAMKPGKPLAFGQGGDAVFFALPGSDCPGSIRASTGRPGCYPAQPSSTSKSDAPSSCRGACSSAKTPGGCSPWRATSPVS
ncbi:MAG TPA: molybdopterin-binding protein, partial [Rhodocyclaceae bacterium]|nr:molybdopterin-binding protein [Rhodocyclaceae bacterium]